MFPFAKKSPTGERGEPMPEPNDGPPDSHRPAGLCPRCGKQSTFEVIGSLPVTLGNTYAADRGGGMQQRHTEQVSSLMCRHCHQSVVVIEEEWVGDKPSREKCKENERSGGLLSFRGFHWWPLPDMALSPDVPADIAGAYSEAFLCLSAGCPRAAVVMARRTLEAITVDKGQTTGNLASRLSNLSNNGVLHPSLTEWIKEVRLIGNTGAHFDPLQEVSKEDARQLLNFIHELLKYLYELPGELARRRART